MAIQQRGKKFIYWVVYFLLLPISFILAHILPIKTASVFLFGLMWIWRGLSLFCSVNPYYAQAYDRRQQLIFAITSVGLGVAWCAISFTPLSSQAAPIIIISLPFLIPDLILFFRHKRA